MPKIFDLARRSLSAKTDFGWGKGAQAPRSRYTGFLGRISSAKPVAFGRTCFDREKCGLSGKFPIGP